MPFPFRGTAFPRQLSGVVTPAIRKEELNMTKRQKANEQFTPLSAVATNAIAPDHTDLAEAPERTPADIAADFANRFLMHRHRGVINCDSYYVIFGNDGWEADQRSRKEMADVCGELRQYEPESGWSSDKMTWALVLTDHTRSSFNEEELSQLVWDTWMEVCDDFEAEMPSESPR